MLSIDLLKQYAPYLVGAAAGLAAFWSQARNFLRYLSSIVVVQSQHDEPIIRALVWHLRANYRRTPSGLYVFRSLMLPIRTSTLYRIVPFRMPSSLALYYGRRGVFLINFENGNITGLRGLSRVQQLICDAIEFYEDVTEREIAGAPLIVVKVMGSMGDQIDQWRKYREDNGQAPAATSPAGRPMESGYNSPDLRIDRSFKYTAADFSTGGSADAFRGLFYDDTAAELIEDAGRWRASQDWYLERGIPWRRGWIFEGPGGTGKSSMAKAIAQKYRLPIYQYYLSTLNDKEFVREWEKMSTPCMVLFEDFDNVFNLREPLTEHKSLTFDCILNQIQGVSSINGVLLVITTNRIERIDPALGSVDENGRASRPGRIDRIVHFGKTDQWMREQIAQYILPDFPDEHAELVAKGQNTTPAQFQYMCIEAAFRLLDRRSTPKLRVVS